MMVKTRKKTLIRCSKILVNSPPMKIVAGVSGAGEVANEKLEDLKIEVGILSFNRGFKL